MIIHTTGRNNCGGRCLIHAHVEDGQIKRLTTESLEEARAAGCEFPMAACKQLDFCQCQRSIRLHLPCFH